MVKLIAEYIWLDRQGNFRSKVQTYESKKINEKDSVSIEAWNYDGSSTGDAEPNSSEIILRPARIIQHPYHKDGCLVLCDTYFDYEFKNPTPHNYRFKLTEKLKDYVNSGAVFGFEQEYFIMDYDQNNDLRPDHFTSGKHVTKQGNYYCGNSQIKLHREIVEEHYLKCLEVGLYICGYNAEVAPSQWEFQIGPINGRGLTEISGIESADQLLLARYILIKIAEKHGKHISFNPKPLNNPWNGSGLHTNMSTNATRTAESGYQEIIRSIEQAKEFHKSDLEHYGDNSKRLTGECETSDPNNFTYGVGDRTASVRIPMFVATKGVGYFEDRRPAADANPYRVMACMVTSFIPPSMNEKTSEPSRVEPVAINSDIVNV